MAFLIKNEKTLVYKERSVIDGPFFLYYVGSMAKVSVIIPAYACAPYIARTLESLQKQSFSDWEAIVVDDGSPDNVADVVAPYVERDSRIRFIHSSNHGVSAARNIGVRESSGEFILPLDGDDIIAPKYIEECLKGFERFEDAAVVYSRWAFFGASNDAVDLRYFSYDHELVRNAIFNCAMFRRKDFDFIGGYDENMSNRASSRCVSLESCFCICSKCSRDGSSYIICVDREMAVISVLS